MIVYLCFETCIDTYSMHMSYAQAPSGDAPEARFDSMSFTRDCSGFQLFRHLFGEYVYDYVYMYIHTCIRYVMRMISYEN